MKAHTAWTCSAGASGANLVVGLCTGVLVARLLGPIGRGELAEVIYWSSLIAGLGLFSIPTALTFSLAQKKTDPADPVNAFAIVAILAVLSIAFGGLLILLVGDTNLRDLALIYLAAFLPVNFLSLTLMAMDHGAQRFIRYNIFRLIPPVTYLLGILFLWWQAEISVATLLMASWLGTFIVCVSWIASCNREFVGRPRIVEMWKLFRTGAKYHTTTIAGTLYQGIDRFVLIALFTHAELGLYAVALTASSAGLGIVSSATSTVLFPKMAAAEGMATHRSHVCNALGVSTILALLTNVTIAAAIPFLVPLLFGPAFVDAVPAAVLLCLAQIPAGVVEMAIVALRGLGDWRAGPHSQLLALVVMVPSAVCLALLFGIAGLAIAFGASQTAVACFLLYRLSRRLRISIVECLTPDRAWLEGYIAQLQKWAVR